MNEITPTKRRKKPEQGEAILICKESGCKNYRVTACYCDIHQKVHRGRPTKNKLIMKCSLCGEQSHNKRTCLQRQIVAQFVSNKAETALEKEESSPKKGRAA